MQIKNAAAEARKEGKRDMRSLHLPLITAEYELLKKEIIEDAKVLTKVKMLSSDAELQSFSALQHRLPQLLQAVHRSRMLPTIALSKCDSPTSCIVYRILPLQVRSLQRHVIVMTPSILQPALRVHRLFCGRSTSLLCQFSEYLMLPSNTS